MVMVEDGVKGGYPPCWLCLRNLLLAHTPSFLISSFLLLSIPFVFRSGIFCLFRFVHSLIHLVACGFRICLIVWDTLITTAATTTTTTTTTITTTNE